MLNTNTQHCSLSSFSKRRYILRILLSGQSINVTKHTIFHRQISVNRSSFRFLCTQGLIVSEISTRHQKGYTEWVLAACGPFAACVHSVLRFAFAVLTNAVYATLFFQYLEHVWMTCFLLSMTSPSFFLLNKNIQKTDVQFISYSISFNFITFFYRH